MANGDPFDFDKEYSVAAKLFMTSGKDGYDAFLDSSITDLPPSVDEAPNI